MAIRNNQPSEEFIRALGCEPAERMNHIRQDLQFLESNWLTLEQEQ